MFGLPKSSFGKHKIIACFSYRRSYLRFSYPFDQGLKVRLFCSPQCYRHDVISSASGSVLVCALIERCYDRRLVTRSSPDWYTTHVVRPIHRLLGENTPSGVWFESVARTLVELRRPQSRCPHVQGACDSCPTWLRRQSQSLWRTKKSRFQPLVKMGMKTVDKNIDKKNKQ